MSSFCNEGYRAEHDKILSVDESEHAANHGTNTSISKNQMKRLLKREKWLAKKKNKRAEDKKKRKLRLADAREKGLDAGYSRKKLKRNLMSNSSCQVKVAIDCSFDEYMTEKDTIHLIQQIQNSYAVNRRAANPLQFYACGITGRVKERLESIGDYHGWDVFVKEEPFTEVFNKETIVYLSSESPNVLEEMLTDKVYVIGGLVDHNHHKGLCYQLAVEKGLAHAQLPLSNYLEMKSRKVLTVNHVFEILLRYTETKDWQASLTSVLPQRKQFAIKPSDRTSSDSSSCSDSREQGISACPEPT